MTIRVGGGGGSGTSGAGLPSTFTTVSGSGSDAAGAYVEADTSGGNVTRTLPSNPAVGSLLVYEKSDTSVNTLTVVPAGSGTIEGDANLTIVSSKGSAILLHKGSDAWKIPSSSAGGPTVPGAPTIGTATGGDASANVAFTAPTNNGGSTITSYTATSTPGSITGSGASSPINVAGLTNGTAYTFKVKATNGVGAGANSASSNSVTPSGAITDPTQISGCVGWYDAMQISGSVNATAISSWPDMSGAGHNLAQATGANQPKWYNASPPAGTVPNSKALVYFGQAGGNTYMDSGSLADPAACTIFVVNERAGAGSPAIFDKAAAGTGRVTGYHPSDTTLEIFAGTSLNGTVTGGPDAWQVLTFLSNGASSKVRKNAVDVASGNAGSNSLGSIRVGADQSAAGHFSGGIAEVVIYSRALTATEYAKVEAYLKAKYGTP